MANGENDGALPRGGRLNDETRRLRLEELRRIAEERGGKLVSDVYSGAHEKVEFEDAAGRRWKATPSSVRNGSWSPHEAGTFCDPESSLRELRSLAEARGGRVVSTEYRNANAKMEFEDAAGRRWTATPSSIRKGTWSPYECGNVPDRFAKMEALRRIAAERGGRVVSEEFLGARSPMEFEDAAGRRWKAVPHSILHGRWSPFEAPNAAEKFAELVRMAAERGGRVVSPRYEGGRTPMEFEDAAGRRWHDRPKRILAGHWSPHERDDAAAERISKRIEATADGEEPAKARRYGWTAARHLAELAAIAESKGGRLISGEYGGSHSKLEFEDASGRRWMAIPAGIRNGAWSPFEGGVRVVEEERLAELSAIAAARGGRLISDVYLGARGLLEFEDSCGRRWMATAHNVRHGSWSPFEGVVGEVICRQAMEHLFGLEFPSVWGRVRRPNGNKLQLDGYCEKIQVAFEYQGPHHESNEDQIERDIEKRAACLREGILLVEVPEFRCARRMRDADAVSAVENAVRSAAEKAGRNLPTLASDGFKIDRSALGKTGTRSRRGLRAG